VEGGCQTTGQLLAHRPETTAIFAYNDLVAVGALQACAAAGRRVPEDMAVVGFDDIPLASLVVPALTTVHVPKYRLGQLVLEMLLALLAGKAEPRVVTIAPELVVRASAP
jgi:LacI family transcriptional regulator